KSGMYSVHGSSRRFEPASFKPSQTAGRSRRRELQAVQPATASVVRSLWRCPSLAVPPVLEATDYGRIDQARVVGACPAQTRWSFSPLCVGRVRVAERLRGLVPVRSAAAPLRCRPAPRGGRL